MKELYIVLIRAHTGLGGVGRKITGFPYTHAAVSLDASLTDFLAFSRKYHYFPYDAGFMHEYRDFYAFGKYQDFGAKVFRLPVSEKRYARLLSYFRRCEKDKDMRFNLFSMLTMQILGGLRIPKAEDCMSFSAKVACMSGSVKLKKPCWRYSLKEIDALLSDYCIFEGNIERKSSQQYEKYMTPFCIIKYLHDAAALICTLTGRLLRKHPDKP